jgi:hypothetical protein
MKKIVLLAIGACMFAATTNAQELMSKRGTPILPEAGDWSIGINAVPFIDWAFDKTRVFSNTGVTSAGSAVSPQQDMTLVGLYMKDANTAYRGKLRIGFGSTSTGHVSTSTSDSLIVPSKVETSGMNITLGAGIQKSRGKGRLHGIYGAEAAIMFGGSNKTTNTYDQALDSAHVAGTGFTSRITEDKTGSTFAFSVDAFIGVEYFFAPKMSLSAEYNWGILIASQGEGETTTQTWDYAANSGSGAAVTKTTKSGDKSAFSVDVNNINSSSTFSTIGSGNIVLHFYF